MGGWAGAWHSQPRGDSRREWLSWTVSSSLRPTCSLLPSRMLCLPFLTRRGGLLQLALITSLPDPRSPASSPSAPLTLLSKLHCFYLKQAWVSSQERAAVTNDCELGDWKQHRFLLLVQETRRPRPRCA